MTLKETKTCKRKEDTNEDIYKPKIMVKLKEINHHISRIMGA